MARKSPKSSSSAEAFRDAVATWEKSANTVANATMANDEFSGVMNQAMKLTLLMQQSLGSVMSVYLSALNLPSKADVATLGERLQGVEARLDRMTVALEQIARILSPTGVSSEPTGLGERPARPMPPRTKRAPRSRPAGDA